ncbi:PmoA family protein [Paenibacillus sp. GYB003]|uniref:DUF6807 domain-containing protein n=1 Tax=Paenibacillus sp. GYB003 TaxID=2994392 RepID=UPI002F962DA3
MGLLFKLRLNAGSHHRDYCPVSYRIAADSPLLQGRDASGLVLLGPGGEPVKLQCEREDGGIVLRWIVERLSAGGTADYEVHAGSGAGLPAETDDAVRLLEKDDRIDVLIGGRFFTSFVYDPQLAKPYIGPVIGPYGDSFTRLDFETREHPHHRSIWVAIGDIDGTDFWNERDGHGKQLIAEFADKTDGPVFAKLTANLNWCNARGKAQLAERRTVTFYNTPAGGRFIDLDVELFADKDRLEFGATKEAGPLGIRVAESMKADNGGTIVNAFGSIGEKECWGVRAPWCDYYGEAGGHTLGIAAFDHPDNDDYPTYWHVRDYGMLAANNLYFAGGKLFRKGQSIRYRHRVYFHEGDTAAAKVADKFQDYIHPPEISIAD